MTWTIRKAAVIGSGTMGGGIAALLTGVGIETVLLDIPAQGTQPGDPADQRNAVALAGVERLRTASPTPLFDPADADKIQVGNLEDDLAQVADCDWIIEVVVERLDVKQSLMRRLAAVARPDALISTNTSGLPIAQIAADLDADFRRRFMGTHFFNPPRYLRLLEVIPGAETDPALVRAFVEFAEKTLGKGVVICKDTPNFIGNRFLTLIGMQTVNAALDDGYTVEEIDALTGTLIGRPRSASFRLLDIIGIDVFHQIVRNLHPAIPHDPARALLEHPGANALFARLIEKGWLGSKTGQGFYKTIKNDAGEREFWSLDLQTLDYLPPRKPTFESVARHVQIANAGARINALFNENDRAADFLRRHLAFYLAYASQRIPEIADSLISIDNAQKWGFSHELGPFEIWDALGVAASLPQIEALSAIPVADWVKTMLDLGCESFYQRENGQVVGVYSPEDRAYRPIGGGS
jgi:3-hydroxyacyl-CoA dehydrogenase